MTCPTHNVGSLGRWVPDDRIARLTCGGTGSHRLDLRGKPYDQDDSVVFLAKTERGKLIVHRQAILSERPPVRYRFELQGTPA